MSMSLTVFEMYSSEVPTHVFVVGNEDSKAYRRRIVKTVETIFMIPPPKLRSPTAALTLKKVREYYHVCKLLGHLDTSCHDFWGTLVLEDYGLPSEGDEPRRDICDGRVRVVLRFVRGYRDGVPAIGEFKQPPVAETKNIRLQNHEAGVLLGQGALRRML